MGPIRAGKERGDTRRNPEAVSAKLRRLSLEEVEHLRAHRWRTAPGRRISNEDDALRFIKELGFVLLMPMRGTDLPSVHRAARRDWIWWDWKQTLPERKACYYAKVLRRRGTFISWEWFPHFYRAYADPRPYWRLYRDGLLDRAEKQILDLLADRGPMMTREVRLAFGPRSKENTRRVKSILVDLQTRFFITAAGGDTAGWSHHRWDLVDRWVPPRAMAAAGRLSVEEARYEIARQFLKNVTMATPADIGWVFGWTKTEVEPVVRRLLDEGRAQPAFVPEVDAEVLILKPWPGHGSRAVRGR
jgi:hypothetical protein